MDKGTIIRTAALLLALVNQCLVMFGKSPLPIDSEFLEQGISYAFTLVTSITAWYKNNYVTKTGVKQKKVLTEKGLTGKGGNQNEADTNH
ncbi:phage holin [Virgibacillus doumboii]|uniref:phage holin n=1 Tax=Virgibacillus doumboii TaxID=2697503 RepID=UPI0013E09075|nr:phage holin [Virgibacillus doumboii]